MKDIPYAQLVGALMYLAIATRPDIAYAVGVLARYSSCPGEAHWRAAKHLLRYLQKTKDAKLSYAPAPDEPASELFTSYTDASYADDEDERKSTSGMVIKIGTGAVSWSSRLQTINVISTTEAEYVAAVSAGQEMIWIRHLLSELGFKVEGPSTLYCDNQAAIQVANDPQHHGRMKHLDLRFYWLRDVVEQGLIKPVYKETKLQTADIMTKALHRVLLQSHYRALGLSDIPNSD